jgi:hypothetical protein
MYISDFVSKMFLKYSKLFFLPGQYAKESRASQYMSKDWNQKLCTSPNCKLPENPPGI